MEWEREELGECEKGGSGRKKVWPQRGLGGEGRVRERNTFKRQAPNGQSGQKGRKFREGETLLDSTRAN